MATVGDVLQQEEKEQLRKGTNKVLPDEEQKALLARTLPGVEKALTKFKERYQSLPVDPVKREARLKDLQNDLNRKVRLIRERVYRGK
jgi:hypothetical protein